MPKAAAAVLLAALSLAAALAVAAPNGQDFATIERGRYLATAGDCAGCHTAEGGQPFAGGLAVETPFGAIVSTNITPDKETGIGLYTDDQFVRAVTHGIRRDGAHLYPAMPYPYFTKARRDDVLAIRAYLATVAPVHHPVQADLLPFPLSVRADMAGWNELYFTPGEFQPVAGKSDQWNRGAYLVEGLMHCGACHTPKNIAGADKDKEWLQGGVLQGWLAPAITGDGRQGLGNWSVDEIAGYLKTGHNDVAAASGPMAEVVAKSTSHLSQADLRAVAAYLKDQPGGDRKAPAPLGNGDPAMQRGAAVYADECSACHTPSGAGVAKLFPKLAGAPAVQNDDPTSLIRVVLSGVRSVATDGAPTAPAMPAFGGLLDDDAVASVLTYIRNSWGNAAPAVTADHVGDQRHSLAKRQE